MRQFFYLMGLCFLTLALSACGGESSDDSGPDKAAESAKMAKESAGPQARESEEEEGPVSASGLSGAKAVAEAKRSAGMVQVTCECYRRVGAFRSEKVFDPITMTSSSSEEAKANIRKACEEKHESWYESVNIRKCQTKSPL